MKRSIKCVGRMARIGVTGAFWGLCAAHWNVLAQAPTANIVTVSFSTAVLQTNEAQRDLAVLHTKFAPRQAQLEALNGEIESLRAQLGEAGDKLSEAERSSRAQTLNQKETQFQRAEEDYRNDSQTEGQEAFQRVAQKMYAFLQDYARQHGYTAVLERGSDAAPVVWYAADNMDITAPVVAAYNSKSGIAPPQPAAKAGERGEKLLPDNPTPSQIRPQTHP